MNAFKLSLFLIVVLGTKIYAQDISSRYAATITPDDLKKHLVIIASDSLEGRDTGSPGQKKAADYVSKHFQQYGLKPIATDPEGKKSYFQKYNLYNRSWGEVYIKSTGKSYQLHENFFIHGLVSFPEETPMPVIWAGYGIESPTYNDYSGIDVKGKAVVIMENEPIAANGIFWVNGNQQKSKWSGPNSWKLKATLALSKGARLVVLLSEKKETEFEKDVRQRAIMSKRLNYLSLKPVEENITNHAAIEISSAMAAVLLNTSSKSLAKLKSKLARKGSWSGIHAPEGTLSIKAQRVTKIIETENVAGLLEGSDKKDEVLVITSHLDHIGISPDGQINNGADDDGSGTVSVLELAQAFSKAKADGHGPRRSILFMTVTGEEKGLFGSEYYSENPLLPLANTIANLNIDMIGRVDKEHEKEHNYVYLIGSDKLSSELHAISEDANKLHVNYKLDYTFNDPKDPNRFYYRSDHYNFAKKGIPVIFYFTGVHADYHQPGDDVEKILFDKQAPIVRLVFHTAWELVNREDRIKVDSNKP